MTATGTGALREFRIVDDDLMFCADTVGSVLLQHGHRYSDSSYIFAVLAAGIEVFRQRGYVLAAIAEAGMAPAGGTLTATPDVRAAVEHMVDGIDTGEDRNIVRRWLGR